MQDLLQSADRRAYQTSAQDHAVIAVAIMKNEAASLLEWVAHHRSIGFDHLVIYENDSDDETPRLLRELSAIGAVSAHHWPSRSGQNKQASAYNDALARYRNRSRWMAFLDGDEFLTLFEADDIHDFLTGYEAFSGVGIPWRTFGSSGQILPTRGFLRDRFLWASSATADPNRHVKSITKSDKIAFANVHMTKVTEGFVADLSGAPIPYEGQGLLKEVVLGPAQINHYFCKSLEEYRQKKARGRAAVAPGAGDEFRDMSLFSAMDYNEEIETSIHRMSAAFEREYEDLCHQLAQARLRESAEIRARNRLTPLEIKADEADLRGALLHHPELRDDFGDPKHLKELIRHLLAQGQFERACTLLPLAEAQGPRGWAHILFARAYDLSGEKDMAKAHWQIFFETRPEHEEARQALGVK